METIYLYSSSISCSILYLWPTFFDMEQCHRFLYSWQDTEPVPCTEKEIFGHHVLQNSLR